MWHVCQTCMQNAGLARMLHACNFFHGLLDMLDLKTVDFESFFTDPKSHLASSRAEVELSEDSCVGELFKLSISEINWSDFVTSTVESISYEELWEAAQSKTFF